jgi:hypothetical protein
LQQFNHCTLLLAFLGTPHGSSDRTQFCESVANAEDAIGMSNAGNSLQLPEFGPLLDVEKSFSTWLQSNSGRVKVVCFYEQLPTSRMSLVGPL